MRWRAKYPEFAEALRFRDEKGTFADNRVKCSLLHKATSLLVPRRGDILRQEGRRRPRPRVEHVPPSDSDTAMIFYLKNPERWSDRREPSVQARPRVPPITPDTSPRQAEAANQRN
jgi:hypothetical protein